MKQITERHTFTGMQKDLDISKFPSTMLYDAHNIRITARKDGTLLAITNEKGTKEVTPNNVTLSGSYLGHCLLRNYLVIFSTDGNLDYITRIDLDILNNSYNNWNSATTELYSGHLNFSKNNPIEAIASYENESIQKVYWVDGLNQPRVINIVGTIRQGLHSESQFDFVRELQLNETVFIEKQFDGSGMFPSGVIQYAFTYYSKNGQESNIFYTSPLIYISPANRGASPEEKVSNSFKVTVSHIDTNFDYLRIYSIQRTSINGTPICKRVQDIAINGLTNIGTAQNPNYRAIYTDTGTNGDSIDPAELLYKGGQNIVANTLCQKDNTLFFGNIALSKTFLTDTQKTSIQNAITISQSTRVLQTKSGSQGTDYNYINQLSCSTNNADNTGGAVPCGGFKRGNYYRVGVQFQDKYGIWSEPIWKDDIRIANAPSHTPDNPNNPDIDIPILTGELTTAMSNTLYGLGYRKIRPLVVFPSGLDRVSLCQGIINPTVYTEKHRGFKDQNDNEYGDKDLYAQSSWFFRPKCASNTPTIDINSNSTATPIFGNNNNDQKLIASGDPFSETSAPYTNPNILRAAEIQGCFELFDTTTTKGGNAFIIDDKFITLHSPDVEFDDSFYNLDFNNKLGLLKTGYVKFRKTFSDIDVQTETSTAIKNIVGFYHNSFTSPWSYGIISGPFYEDGILDDYSDGTDIHLYSSCPVRWMIYPWQRKGPINNDTEEVSSHKASSILKKKIISNLRYSNSVYTSITINNDDEIVGLIEPNDIKLFSSNDVEIIKLGDNIYKGNVDTDLVPDVPDGSYFVFEGSSSSDFQNKPVTLFNSRSWWAVGGLGLWKYNNNSSSWSKEVDYIGDHEISVCVSNASVKMRYKSTPHLVADINTVINEEVSPTKNSILPIVDIIQEDGAYRDTMFGGRSTDALKANEWIPCGFPVLLKHGNQTGNVLFKYSFGDTYFQRWDCLKTYAFSNEDINQIVEIGSFMLETYVNIDGRYDRNRGQVSNLHMSPVNFNLINPVYSQKDNFFTYRILDNSFYETNRFSNQITWTKEKQSGADIDLWTNISLGTVYDVDGSKGKINYLTTWKDNIFCFQDRGISKVLFNSRVQIPVSDGVPIEISNNYKVDGVTYLTEGIGCSNKWTVAGTPTGLYFIDSIKNHLYCIGESIQDISTSRSMASWFDTLKTSNSLGEEIIARVLYDNIHEDLYIVTKLIPTLLDDEPDSISLCYSELLGQFVSFYDYSRIRLLECNNSYTYVLRENAQKSGGTLHTLFEGEYDSIFGNTTSWDFTIISNGLDRNITDFDKIFTNLEYRMDVFNSDSEYVADESLTSIEVSNEYQYSSTGLQWKRPSDNAYNISPSQTLQKKFKIWRIQIPRAQKFINGNYVFTNDRIRNPWCKIKLSKENNEYHYKAVLHDMNVLYYI